jgi:hypothetical protein
MLRSDMLKRLGITITAMFLAISAVAVAASFGPAADIAAVRATHHQVKPAQQVGEVHVVGNYSVLEASSGNADWVAFYKRVSGERWRLVDETGGMYAPSDLVHFGVPASVAHQLLSNW